MSTVIFGAARLEPQQINATAFPAAIYIPTAPTNNLAAIMKNSTIVTGIKQTPSLARPIDGQ